MGLGIVGAGVMGAEIAWLGASAERDVVLIDTQVAALDTARERIAGIGGRRLSKGRMTEVEVDRAVAHVTYEESLDAVAGCDVVIEAVTERIEVKRSVFAELGEAADHGALLASNTSGLSISDLGSASGRAERTVGLHFFNPASVMPLVEVVRGRETSDASHEEAMTLAGNLGKTPVAVAECPGFLVNRVLCRAMASAYCAAEATAADPAAVDEAIVAGGPTPMGPFTLGNLVGLDTLSFLLVDLKAAYGDRFAQGHGLPALVAAGKLGDKSGGGFALDASAGGGAPAEAVDAYYAAARDEAIRCRDEEIATPDDINLALRLGAGWETGPLEAAA